MFVSISMLIILTLVITFAFVAAYIYGEDLIDLLGTIVIVFIGIISMIFMVYLLKLGVHSVKESLTVFETGFALLFGAIAGFTYYYHNYQRFLRREEESPGELNMIIMQVISLCVAIAFIIYYAYFE